MQGQKDYLIAVTSRLNCGELRRVSPAVGVYAAERVEVDANDTLWSISRRIYVTSEENWTPV